MEITPKRLFRIRQMLGSDEKPMPRANFAIDLGTTEGTIYRWESGKQPPRVISQRAVEAYISKKLTREQLRELETIEGDEPIAIR